MSGDPERARLLSIVVDRSTMVPAVSLDIRERPNQKAMRHGPSAMVCIEDSVVF